MRKGTFKLVWYRKVRYICWNFSQSISKVDATGTLRIRTRFQA